MRVKAIMMPFSKLACISVENTVEEAMKIIDEQGLLSLPVVDGQQFVGVSVSYTHLTLPTIRLV